MSAGPVQLIVAAYPDADEAARRLAETKDGRRAGMFGIIDAAAIAKTRRGELKLTNARHRERRGLLVGGLIGGVLGVVAGPVALTTAGQRLSDAGDGTGRFDGFLASDDGLVLAGAELTDELLPKEGDTHG